MEQDQTFFCEQLFSAEDGARILCLRVQYTSTFYATAADAFAKSVKERIFPMAKEAYIACEDRRKRYRFPLWTAEFSAVCENETDAVSNASVAPVNPIVETSSKGKKTERTAYRLCIRIYGKILRLERHHFEDGLLIKRERLSHMP